MKFINALSTRDVFAQLRERAASPDRVMAAKAKMLLRLVEYLQGRGPEPRAGVTLLRDVLSITLVHPSRHVAVCVDWQDRGEVCDGLPFMHYRLQMRTPGETLSSEARVATIVEAAAVILCA